MDRIPFWSDQLGRKPIEVPFLYWHCFRYGDLGFLTYTCRVGVDTTSLAEDNLPTMRLEDSGALLQAWLLPFGLLNQSVLTVARYTAFSKRLSFTIFTKSGDGFRHLSARNSEECRRTDVKARSQPSYRSFRSARVALCVQYATSLIRSALSSKYLRGLLSKHETNLDSLATIYYLGYCPNSRKCCYYHQHGRLQCPCSNGDGPKHSPKHISSDCSCKHLSAPPSTACLATLSSKITLCRFQTEHGGRISLVAQPLEDLGSTPYIAISHVRSAGLGNSYGNFLPSCQVKRLQTMADEVSKSLGMGKDTLFWIDTLCLSMTRDRKDVTPVRHIFSMAKAVLVLDPRLCRQSFVLSQKALKCIRYSRWKERLWTLEEGSTARHLFFKFSQRMVTLESLLAKMEKWRNNDHLESVVRRIQPQYVANDLPGTHALHLLAEHLADDLQAVRGEFRDEPETAALDKEKLKRILRLGYLANPAFRYFVEEDEYRGILSIRAPLVEAYGGLGYDRRPPGSRRNLADLLNRLTIMNSISLSGG